MSKDWTGDGNSVFKTIGASNHTNEQREINDYYATDPKCLRELLKYETFNPYVWECACGGGHLSQLLIDEGYRVKSSDVVNRGFNDTEIIDFLKVTKEDIKNDYSRDIISNPPYKYAKEFVEHALDISMDSVKVAMFLKVTFLEGQARRELFKKYPPCRVYVFSKRMTCAKNGDFGYCKQGAVAYAWFIWEKGFKGDPVIKWI